MDAEGPDLPLCFSSPWAAEPELETDSWSGDDPLALEELDESGWDTLEIPGDDGDALAPEGWNLTTELLRSPMRVAMAAMVPLLLTATPALGFEPPVATELDSSGAESEPAAEPPFVAVTTTAAPVMQPELQPEDQPPIWEGLVDRLVILTMADGIRTRGTVLSASDKTLVFAQASDGLVVLVDTAAITTVNVLGLPTAANQRRPQDGQGLIVFGAIATGIGGALVLATAAVAVDCLNAYGYTCPWMTLPLGITGAVNLAVGIPMLVAGKRNRKQARAANETASVQVNSVFVAPNREGVMAGVGLRF
jgi:hypothetical protein